MQASQHFPWVPDQVASSTVCSYENSCETLATDGNLAATKSDAA
jgi:hypothetical protein